MAIFIYKALVQPETNNVWAFTYIIICGAPFRLWRASLTSDNFAKNNFYNIVLKPLKLRVKLSRFWAPRKKKKKIKKKIKEKNI